MKAPSRKFSTSSGILWIGVFFCLLFLLPIITATRSIDFKPTDSEASNTTKFFPMDVKLVVYRDTSHKRRSTRSKVTLRELIKESKGPVLINFWATWCPPCLEELPSIETFSRQTSDNNSNPALIKPNLITISVDDRIEDISKLESSLDFKPTFSVMYDKEGELARSMGTTKFPETYLITPEGKVLYKWLGPQDWLSHDVLQQLKSHYP